MLQIQPCYKFCSCKSDTWRQTRQNRSSSYTKTTYSCSLNNFRYQLKVFLQHKILPGNAILSTCTHTQVLRHRTIIITLHTIYNQFKRKYVGIYGHNYISPSSARTCQHRASYVYVVSASCKLRLLSVGIVQAKFTAYSVSIVQGMFTRSL